MNRRVDQKLPFDTRYFNEYYERYRNKLDDLFDSEKHFIHDFVAPNKSYLDIGCAVGGMYKILSSLESSIIYTGIDISPEMIKCACKNYPSVDFKTYDGISLPFKDNSFECVLTLGTTVHDQEFNKLVTEAYRVTGEILFFDIRLVENQDTLKSLNKAYVMDGAGVKYPYVVVNWKEFVTLIKNLRPLPELVRGYGYWGSANKDTTLPKGYEKICMSTFLIYKNQDNQHMKFDMELPFIQ